MADEEKQDTDEQQPEEITEEQPDNTKATEGIKKWLDDAEEAETETEPEPETAAEEPEAEPESKPEPEPVTEPKFDEQLLADAEQIGMTWDEVQRLGPEGTRIAVNNAIRVAQSFQQKTEPAKEVEPKEDPFKLENEEDIDPDLLKYMKGLKANQDRIEQENAQLRDELSHVRGKTDQISQRELEEESTKFISNLDTVLNDSGMTDVFGTDGESATDEQFANRRQVFDAAMDLEYVYKNIRRQTPPKDLIQRALYAEFGHRVKENATREVSERVSKRAGQSISRPTQRQSSSSGSDAKALAVIKEHLAQMDSE